MQQGFQLGLRLFSPQSLSALDIQVFAFTLNGIQLTDAMQGFAGKGTLIGGVQLKEFPARMRHAPQFRDAACEQRLVAAIVVDHQMPPPAMQEVSRMAARPIWLKVEHDNRRPALQVVAAVRPQIRPFRFALPGIEQRHRRFIRMQDQALPEQFGQAIRQRLQGHADSAHPVGQRGTRNRHPLPAADLLDPVQRQMIQEFLHGHPRMQTRCAQAAVDHRCGNRLGRDGVAGTAGVLGADVPMHEETCRLDIELFGNIFADLDQILAALAAGARSRFMPVFDSRQMLRQGLAAAGFACLPLRRDGVGELIQFRFHGPPDRCSSFPGTIRAARG